MRTLIFLFGMKTLVVIASYALSLLTIMLFLKHQCWLKGFTVLICNIGHNTVTIGINGWDTPGDIINWDSGTGKVTNPFSSQLAGLSKSQLVKPESISLQARGRHNSAWTFIYASVRQQTNRKTTGLVQSAWWTPLHNHGLFLTI